MPYEPPRAPRQPQRSQARFDGHRYIGCRWCSGSGCLACEGEAKKAYDREFPNGPKPIAVFRTDEMAKARELLGPDAINKHFGPGGDGMDGFVASLKAAGVTPDEEPS